VQVQVAQGEFTEKGALRRAAGGSTRSRPISTFFKDLDVDGGNE